MRCTRSHRRQAHPKSNSKKTKLDAIETSDRKPGLSELNGNTMFTLNVNGRTIIELEEFNERLQEKIAEKRAAEQQEVETLLEGDLAGLGADALRQLVARAKAAGVAGVAVASAQALLAAREEEEGEETGIGGSSEGPSDSSKPKRSSKGEGKKKRKKKNGAEQVAAARCHRRGRRHRH